jgi:hypothetical protein
MSVILDRCPFYEEATQVDTTQEMRLSLLLVPEGRLIIAQRFIAG